MYGKGLHISFNTELWVRTSNVKMASQPFPATSVAEITMRQCFTHPFESYGLRLHSQSTGSHHPTAQKFFLMQERNEGYESLYFAWNCFRGFFRKNLMIMLTPF